MRKVTFVCFVSLGIMLIGLTSGRSQANAQGFASLKLEVSPEKARFVLGEPLTLKITLTNPTQSEITAYRTLDAEYGNIQVYLALPGDTFKEYLGPHWGVSERRPKAGPIAPGESVYGEITLLFHNLIPGQEDL